MSAVLAQRVGDTVYVLDEMVLGDAHTENACEALLEKTREWQRRGKIAPDIYGDASGYQRRTTGGADGLGFGAGVSRKVAWDFRLAFACAEGEWLGAGSRGLGEQPIVSLRGGEAAGGGSAMPGVDSGF